MEEKFQNELRCRRRARGESLRELSQDIRRLMTLAYPGEKSGLSEHIARDAFLCALDDPEFELKIREREPADLDSAVKLAQRFEVFKASVESSSSTLHKVNRHVTVETEQDTVSASMALETRLANVEQQMRQVRSPPVTKQLPQQQPIGHTEACDVVWRNRAVCGEDSKWKTEMSK